MLLICPASPGSRSGNRTTALRWAAKLRALGHRVRIAGEYRGEVCDVLIALHACKSAPSVFRFAEERPGKAIVVALTGTDLYRDLPGSAEGGKALELAWSIAVLQPRAIERIAEPLRRKVRVIYQSAIPACAPPSAPPEHFDICVLGHLRDEKDPFRAAEAARLLPAASRIRILQAGAALTPEFEERARREQAGNPRYRWLGEVTRREARRLLASSRALALTSRMEGGANVISEAIVDGVPVFASRIDGSLGLLGDGYPGYYEVCDTGGLMRLMSSFEENAAFRQRLLEECLSLAPLFRPERELEAWRELLESYDNPSASTSKA